MARVVISGYYGFNNTGDEAVLYSMVQALRSLEPGLGITVLSQRPQQTAAALGVEAVNRWQPAAVAEAIRQADLFISGGGSLFQDVTGPKSLCYYAGLITLARTLGKPAMCYAQGLGPLKRSWSRRLAAKVLDGMQLITLRDSESRQLLVELGVNKPPVYVTADPVLGLEPETMDLQPGLDRWRQFELSGPVVGISVRSWPVAATFWQELAAAADGLVAGGWQVVFLPFQFPADVEACRQVARLMHQPSLVIREKMSLPTIMAIIGKLQFLIGMRLHALILAAVMGVPFMALSYDPKVAAFARSMEQALLVSLSGVTASSLQEMLRVALGNREEQAQRVQAAAAELKPRALDNARLAVDYLKKGAISG
ncbi:MAG: polysaccharide pyruvyl transferase CsaB [Clostridia bacterium]|nr:polysaccharide pyruvyl transferase CsaB [Clostridia bacterium]